MKFLFCILLFFPHIVWAFPEMVRYGYFNCTSCHVSPTGEGILTPYGRSLSREILSTWGKETEPEFAYDMFSLPPWMNFTGKYRSVYMYRDTPRVREGRYILMQLDFEGALMYKGLGLVGALGRKATIKAESWQDHIFSRRHYINFRPSDEVSLRLGKFHHAFGINVPDHIIPTKRALGWDQGEETYNFEAALLKEQVSAYVTAVSGNPNVGKAEREKGLAVTANVFLWDRLKPGVSYFWGDKKDQRRHVFGPYGILGFTPSLFLLTELDFQFLKPQATKEQKGIVNYQRLDYEWVQGFHTYVTQEMSRLDFKNKKSRSDAYGFGLQFFPRPHFEFNLLWQKKRSLSISTEYFDFAWFMFNFYL